MTRARAGKILAERFGFDELQYRQFEPIVTWAAVLLIVAMAALVPLVCRQYDFSVGATVGLSSVLVASVVSGGSSLAVAILGAE